MHDSKFRLCQSHCSGSLCSVQQFVTVNFFSFFSFFFTCFLMNFQSLHCGHLIYLALSREQGLSVTQLAEDTPHRPHVYRLSVGSSEEERGQM